MIEVIYKEENPEVPDEEDFVHVPRNIRQIGLVGDCCKIYIEDYVYTFLTRLSRAEDEKGNLKERMAVLTGETKWQGGVAYLFIKGALIAKEDVAPEHMDLSEVNWQEIRQEQEKYFREQEIVGWFFSRPQLPMETDEIFTRIHLKYFGGEKVLMLMEPQEREDAFFRYENGFMGKQSGYYIYYEKNPQMQAYMLEKNTLLQIESTETDEDTAVRNFRRIITGKKSEAEEGPSVFSYAATAALAVAVLAVGVNFYHNYQKMRSIETEIRQASAVIVEEVTPVPTQKAQVSALGANKTDAGKETQGESLRVTPSPGQTEETGKGTPKENAEAKAKEAKETAGEKLYREESDVRKAQRRKDREEKETASDKVHETYVIKPGDTIFQISMAKYGTMDAMAQICSLNDLSLEEIIYPGQVIVLP